MQALDFLAAINRITLRDDTGDVGFEFLPRVERMRVEPSKFHPLEQRLAFRGGIYLHHALFGPAPSPGHPGGAVLGAIQGALFVAFARGLIPGDPRTTGAVIGVLGPILMGLMSPWLYSPFARRSRP